MGLFSYLKVSGFQPLASCFWFLITGHWILNTGYWLPDTG
jgi:hypothetical protein